MTKQHATPPMAERRSAVHTHAAARTWLHAALHGSYTSDRPIWLL